MSWTPPVTQPAGHIVTVSEWNEQVVDNLTYLYGPTRKTTSKVVNNSVAETDLLNGEISIPAGALGTSGVLRLTMWGDILNNTGAQQFGPRFKVKLGASATVVLDTNVDDSNNAGAKALYFSASRWAWRFVLEVQNLGATNAQAVYLSGESAQQVGNSGATKIFAVGEGAGAARCGTATGNGYGWSGLNTAAIDTTAAMAIQFTVINPVASTSMETKLFGAVPKLG